MAFLKHFGRSKSPPATIGNPSDFRMVVGMSDQSESTQGIHPDIVQVFQAYGIKKKDVMSDIDVIQFLIDISKDYSHESTLPPEKMNKLAGLVQRLSNERDIRQRNLLKTKQHCSLEQAGQLVPHPFGPHSLPPNGPNSLGAGPASFISSRGAKSPAPPIPPRGANSPAPPIPPRGANSPAPPHLNFPNPTPPGGSTSSNAVQPNFPSIVAPTWTSPSFNTPTARPVSPPPALVVPPSAPPPPPLKTDTERKDSVDFGTSAQTQCSASASSAPSRQSRQSPPPASFLADIKNFPKNGGLSPAPALLTPEQKEQNKLIKDLEKIIDAMKIRINPANRDNDEENDDW